VALWYVDFTAATNGSGTTSGSPLNSPAAIVTAAPAAGDTVYCVNTLAGAFALSTLAGGSLANPIHFVGVTSLTTLDRSSRTQINASGVSGALTGSGNYLMFTNFDFRNSTSTTHQHTGSNLTFTRCDFRKGTGSATVAASVFDNYMRGCRFYDYSGSALTNAGVSGAAVEDCYFNNCGTALTTSGYRSLVIRNNVFVTMSGNGISVPNNGLVGTSYAIQNNTFSAITGDAIVFGGTGNSEVQVCYNIFGTVTGTAIKITSAPSSTTIGAHNNYFYSCGTTLGSNVKDLGLNATLGTNPFTNTPTDVTVTSASGLRGMWSNDASFGGMQIGAGGGAAGALIPVGFDGGLLG